MKTLIQNVTVVNEGSLTLADVVLENDQIADILPAQSLSSDHFQEVVDGSGKHLLPGLIDDQVHFREPGLTHKGEIYTEAKAAVAGGITSFMEMPNTVPNTVTFEELEKKYQRAADVSLANYSFYLGATQTNAHLMGDVDIRNVCGIKIFMGSSTGNMLVDNEDSLNAIFKNAKTLIATHCEDDQMIAANFQRIQSQFPDGIPVQQHPIIRNAEACYASSSKAIALAKKHDAQLHILHISTAKEIDLFTNQDLKNKRITAEACVHHLWFSDEDYNTLGSRIKWNPAVKTANDRAAIRQALKDGYIDVLATDHAPHTLAEKANPYSSCPSGGPLVQHALPALLEMCHQGIFTIHEVVQKACHNVALLYNISNRGFIKKGYKADLVLVDLNATWLATDENSLYKCQWTPFNNTLFHNRVEKTWVNGHCAYDNGVFDEKIKGEQLTFNR
ncbi:MAG: hypothetical protein RLY35_53 [Bacteroidota bacterium]|jgi:dihydroorotase